MKRLVYFSFISIRGNVLRGDGSTVLGDQQGSLPQGDSSLNPLTLQGKLCRDSGPLTLWGTGVYLSPGDLEHSIPSKIVPCKS